MMEAAYIHYTVTELSGVTSLEGWRNTQVSVVGMLCHIDLEKKTSVLHETGQLHHSVKIMVDCNSDLNGSFTEFENCLVTILGDISIRRGKLVLLAYFIQYCPILNVKRCKAAKEGLRSLGINC